MNLNKNLSKIIGACIVTGVLIITIATCHKSNVSAPVVNSEVAHGNWNLPVAIRISKCIQRTLNALCVILKWSA